MQFFKRKLLGFQIFSIIFTWFLGTILHFTYEWSNQNAIIGAFSAVNESTWEHLKLLFFPMLITTIIGHIYLKPKENYENFWCAKTIGIVVALSFVIIFFYTYTGIVGTNFSILDIGSFFVGTFIGEYTTYKLMVKKVKCNKIISILVLTILLICFIIFTYNPPNIELFRDPIVTS